MSQELYEELYESYDSPKTDKKKRRYVPHCERTTDSINKRNARERRRMERFNNAFHALKMRLPTLKKAKKRVAKERIMREAAEYIQQLSSLLGVSMTPIPVTPQWFDHFLSTEETSLDGTDFSHLRACLSSNSSSTSSFDSEDDQQVTSGPSMKVVSLGEVVLATKVVPQTLPHLNPDEISHILDNEDSMESTIFFDTLDEFEQAPGNASSTGSKNITSAEDTDLDISSKDDIVARAVEEANIRDFLEDPEMSFNFDQLAWI